MKRASLLLAILLFQLNSWSQKSDLLDSIIVIYYSSPTDSSFQGKEVFEYDMYGNKVLHVYYAWAKGENKWMPSDKFVDAFNSNGDPVLESRYRWGSDLNVGKSDTMTTPGRFQLTIPMP